jgi:hypothetical protein
MKALDAGKDDIMKNPISGKAMFFALAATTLLWVAPAGAQQSRMRMEIPFAFVAGERLLPAGPYWVTVDQDFLRCRFDGALTSTVQITRLLSVTDNRPSTKAEYGTLRFAVYGGRYFLSNVWRPGHEEGNRAVVSKRLLEAARSNSNDAGPAVTTVVAPN